MTEELEDLSKEIEDRIAEIERLKENTHLNQRTTIDQRDVFSWCLYRMLQGHTSEGSFVPTSSIGTLAVEMQQAKDETVASSSNLGFEHNLDCIAACVRQAEEHVDATNPPSQPVAFRGSLEQLEQASKQLKSKLAQHLQTSQVLTEKTEMAPAHDKYKHTMFVKLFTDPRNVYQELQKNGVT